MLPSRARLLEAMHPMRARFGFFLLATAVTSGSSHAQSSPRVEDASWLAGCWSMRHADGSTQEHWLPPAGGAMLGLSRTIRGGKMTEHEYLAIREVDGKLTYVAIPSGQREAAFPLLRVSPNELVFENPSHDFPQRVIYRKLPDGMAARIEGVVGGKSRSRDFPFERCK
jgi:Domain of unknown function (DUF6265)